MEGNKKRVVVIVRISELFMHLCSVCVHFELEVSKRTRQIRKIYKQFECAFGTTILFFKI